MKTSKISCLLISLILWFGVFSTQAQHLKKEINFKQHKLLPFYGIKKAGNTTIFQGNKKKRKYFEGWYFKMVAEDGASILSVIPGISLSNTGEEQHAFIQLIDGVTAQTRYYIFPIETFSFSKKEFSIKIGENYFSKDRIILNLKDSNSSVSGKIEMFNRVDYKTGRLINPGIMGWYRFVPFMQCYHGVVSLTHDLNGKLSKDGEVYNFDKGKGYIEKDWGTSMPSAWIWMQSNNFSVSNNSFMLSIADIPWLGKSFPGFLGFFYHNDHLYRFATYSHAKLQLEIPDSSSLKIKIKDRKNTFILEARTQNMGVLKAPVEGSMDRRIPESIDATLKITLLDNTGSVVFMDSTEIAGLEMVGDLNKINGIPK